MLTAGVKLTDLTEQQVLELQNLLQRAGYNPGALDGKFGPQTKAAYSRFLTKNGHDARADVIVKLASDLFANHTPELWGGITMGGETAPPAAPATTTSAVTAAPTAAPASVPTSTPSTAVTPYVAPATPNLSTGEMEEQVRKQFPMLAYLLDNPEVKDVLMRGVEGSWTQDQLQAEMMKTWWWKTTSEVTRLWDAKFNVDPAKAQYEWDQRTVSVLNLAQQMGAPVDEAGAKWLAGRILREGWSDEQLKRFLGQVIRNAGGAEPGQVTEQVAQIKQLGRSYLSNLTEKSAQEFAVRIAEGSMSREGIETMLRNEAKNRFTWLAPQIDSGLTPMDLFGSTRSAVAQMLEMDPEQIDLNNPMWSQLTSPIQGEGGQMRSMNFYEAQRWARQRPEWRLTDNANRASSEIGLNLLKGMGMVK